MRWAGDHLLLLDQRLLPEHEVWLELRTWEQVAEAIREMAVRGAPAIGIAAAYGVAMGATKGESQQALEGLAKSRPTAVNLFWALDRIRKIAGQGAGAVLSEAQAIEREDLECNRRIGKIGAELVPRGARILTICNTGSLATAGVGTAMGIITTAHAEGKSPFVYSCETRPRLQGLKLTAWELQREGIPFQSIVDSASAALMRAGKVDIVITGADRIAANGDTANKIGTYSLAVAARYHRIPFYVAAPTSSLDRSLASGDAIEIEERHASEITHVGETCIAPGDCTVFNPAFDVTPGDLISAIITEDGLHRPPYCFES